MSRKTQYCKEVLIYIEPQKEVYPVDSMDNTSRTGEYKENRWYNDFRKDMGGVGIRVRIMEVGGGKLNRKRKRA